MNIAIIGIGLIGGSIALGIRGFQNNLFELIKEANKIRSVLDKKNMN